MTWEELNGEKTEIEAQFRAYNSYEESLADHQALLLCPRYVPVRKADSPEEAARQLYKCGYATDPDYANKLISIMRDYRLKQYDTILPVPGPFPDVPGDRPEAKYVTAVKRKGIMVGSDDGNFWPDRPLSRAEAAVVICRALGLDVEEEEDQNVC